MSLLETISKNIKNLDELPGIGNAREIDALYNFKANEL